MSTSIRKIDNGWIKTTSHSKGDSYKSREEFHAQKPSLAEGKKENPGTKVAPKVSGSMKPVTKAGGSKGGK